MEGCTAKDNSAVYDGGERYLFGDSVSLYEDTALIGSYGNSSSAYTNDVSGDIN